MSVLSVIAFVTGILGVWLTIKQNIYCWPVALVSVVTSMIEFYYQRLYGDMTLQVVYFAAGVYGWVFWSRNLAAGFSVTNMPRRLGLPLVIITMAQAALYYSALKFWGGDKALFDSVLTACSLTATYMMIRKWVENWFAWVLIDTAYVFLYAIKDMWLFALLYLFFACIALAGWLKWKREAS